MICPSIEVGLMGRIVENRAGFVCGCMFVYTKVLFSMDEILWFSRREECGLCV